MSARPLCVALIGMVGFGLQACGGSPPAVSAEDERVTQSTLDSAMKALSAAVDGGRPPQRINVRSLQRLGVELPSGISIGAAERTGQGGSTTYKLCLLHERGYWAADAYPNPARESGRGDQCDIAVGEEASPLGERP